LAFSKKRKKEKGRLAPMTTDLLRNCKDPSTVARIYRSDRIAVDFKSSGLLDLVPHSKASTSLCRAVVIPTTEAAKASLPTYSGALDTFQIGKLLWG
jgi:hypothetical protein